MTFIPPTSEGPTIEKLESGKSTENLTGAPLAGSKTLFGKIYYFYEDRSVLIEDPKKQEYHFLTEGGREKGRMLREATRTILDNDAELEKMRELGRGRGGFSTVYELETPEGSIAIKTTNSSGYYLKEHSEEITSKAEPPTVW